MTKDKALQPAAYTTLKETIGDILQQGRTEAAKAVNTVLLQSYWQIGRHIVEFEQKGSKKAQYGNQLLTKLSKDLTLEFGKGFSRSNLFLIRKLYLTFSKIQTVSGKSESSETLSSLLSWSHYAEILKSDNDLEINFYIKQCEKENWSVRELKRQMKSMLFHRLALSKDKAGILAIANKGCRLQEPKDIIKDPYVFEFLGIMPQEQYTEGELEQKLIQNLENFLLELGNGFAFIGRQYKITLANRHFFVDLVFYHRILSKYQLYLPDRKHLQAELEKILNYE